MSVIFQALQQLDTGEATEAADRKGAACPQDRAAKPKLFLRCVLITAVACLLVVLGLGAVHGVRLLAGQVQQAPAAEEEPVRHPLPAERPASQENSDRPASSERGAAPLQARYLPPAPDPTSPDRPIARGENPPSDFRAADAAALKNASPGRDNDAPPASLSKDIPPKQLSKSGRSLDSDAQTAAPDPIKSNLSGPDETNEEIWKQARARRQAVLEKQAHISRLVGRIERAIQTSAQTDTMMAELSRLKGADSRYVRKLKAFQLLKSGAYDQAEVLLKQVSSDDETDLEAGFNLAVIEARTGREAQAVRRLKQLRILYPDDERIEDLLRKLKGS